MADRIYEHPGLVSFRAPGMGERGELSVKVYSRNQQHVPPTDPRVMVQVICTEGYFYIHKTLLVVNSPMLKELLREDTEDTPVLRLADVDVQVAEKLFRCIYQGYTVATGFAEVRAIESLARSLDFRPFTSTVATREDKSRSCPLISCLGNPVVEVPRTNVPVVTAPVRVNQQSTSASNGNTTNPAATAAGSAPPLERCAPPPSLGFAPIVNRRSSSPYLSILPTSFSTSALVDFSQRQSGFQQLRNKLAGIRELKGETESNQAPSGSRQHGNYCYDNRADRTENTQAPSFLRQNSSDAPRKRKREELPVFMKTIREPSPNKVPRVDCRDPVLTSSDPQQSTSKACPPAGGKKVTEMYIPSFRKILPNPVLSPDRIPRENPIRKPKPKPEEVPCPTRASMRNALMKQQREQQPSSTQQNVGTAGTRSKSDKDKVNTTQQEDASNESGQVPKDDDGSDGRQGGQKCYFCGSELRTIKELVDHLKTCMSHLNVTLATLTNRTCTFCAKKLRRRSSVSAYLRHLIRCCNELVTPNADSSVTSASKNAPATRNKSDKNDAKDTAKKSPDKNMAATNEISDKKNAGNSTPKNVAPSNKFSDKNKAEDGSKKSAYKNVADNSKMSEKRNAVRVTRNSADKNTATSNKKSDQNNARDGSKNVADKNVADYSRMSEKKNAVRVTRNSADKNTAVANKKSDNSNAEDVFKSPAYKNAASEKRNAVRVTRNSADKGTANIDKNFDKTADVDKKAGGENLDKRNVAENGKYSANKNSVDANRNSTSKNAANSGRNSVNKGAVDTRKKPDKKDVDDNAVGAGNIPTSTNSRNAVRKKASVQNTKQSPGSDSSICSSASSFGSPLTQGEVIELGNLTIPLGVSVSGVKQLAKKYKKKLNIGDMFLAVCFPKKGMQQVPTPGHCGPKTAAPGRNEVPKGDAVSGSGDKNKKSAVSSKDQDPSYGELEALKDMGALKISDPKRKTRDHGKNIEQTITPMTGPSSAALRQILADREKCLRTPTKPQQGDQAAASPPPKPVFKKPGPACATGRRSISANTGASRTPSTSTSVTSLKIEERPGVATPGFNNTAGTQSTPASVKGPTQIQSVTEVSSPDGHIANPQTSSNQVPAASPQSPGDRLNIVRISSINLNPRSKAAEINTVNTVIAGVAADKSPLSCLPGQQTGANSAAAAPRHSLNRIAGSFSRLVTAARAQEAAKQQQAAKQKETVKQQQAVQIFEGRPMPLSRKKAVSAYSNVNASNSEVRHTSPFGKQPEYQSRYATRTAEQRQREIDRRVRSPALQTERRTLTSQQLILPQKRSLDSTDKTEGGASTTSRLKIPRQAEVSTLGSGNSEELTAGGTANSITAEQYENSSNVPVNADDFPENRGMQRAESVSSIKILDVRSLAQEYAAAEAEVETNQSSQFSIHLNAETQKAESGAASTSTSIFANSKDDRSTCTAKQGKAETYDSSVKRRGKAFLDRLTFSTKVANVVKNLGRALNGPVPAEASSSSISAGVSAQSTQSANTNRNAVREESRHVSSIIPESRPTGTDAGRSDGQSSFSHKASSSRTSAKNKEKEKPAVSSANQPGAVVPWLENASGDEPLVENPVSPDEGASIDPLAMDVDNHEHGNNEEEVRNPGNQARAHEADGSLDLGYVGPRDLTSMAMVTAPSQLEDIPRHEEVVTAEGRRVFRCSACRMVYTCLDTFQDHICY